MLNEYGKVCSMKSLTHPQTQIYFSNPSIRNRYISIAVTSYFLFVITL